MGEKETKCPKCGATNPIYIEETDSYICRKEGCEHKFTLEAKSAPKKIFMSYGHDEYEKLTLKIKKDLEVLGHEVWFDRSELKVGRDWEISIENGLKNTEKVIVLMTPHSMRRPDGYCLNELSMACTLKKDILPIMVRDCIPPLSVHRIQYLDFREWPCTDEKYQEKFAQIREVVEGRKLRFEGANSYLLNKLEPLDFKAEIDKHIKNFYGREWIFEEIKDWLYSDSDSRIFFLTGKPGVGKTTFSAMLCHRFPEVKAYHFVKFNDVRKSDALECVLSIAYQLSTQMLDYADKLREINFEKLKEKNAQTVFDELIIQPLSNVKPPSKPVLIVIDALDEAKKGDRNELVSFISNTFNLTPSWIKLFITSRPEPDVLGSLASLSPHLLDNEDDRNLRDIKEFLILKLGELFSDKDTGEAIEAILKRSKGIFLYIQEVLNELRMGRLDIDFPEQFPKGLKQVYKNYFNRQFPNLEEYKINQRPLLEIIAAAREPLTLKLIRKILEWDDYSEKNSIEPLGSFLEIDEGKVIPFHGSLMTWLVDQQTGKDFFISLTEGHNKIVLYGLKAYNSDPKNIPDYFMKYLPAHLIALMKWDDLNKLLRDSRYIEKLKFSELRGFPELVTYYYWGLIYRFTKPDKAIEYFNKVLKLDPRIKNAWHCKGEILYELRNYEKAIECYDKALKIDSKFFEVWYNKGYSLISLNRWEEAIACFDKTLEFNSNSTLALNNKGYALSRLNKYLEAIECFDKALELDQEFSEVWYNKGTVLINLNNYEEGIECFNKALEIDPKSTLAWNSKGLTLSNLIRYEEAIKCFDKTLKIEPKSDETWYNKGDALYNLNLLEEAIECYNKSLEFNPKNSLAWNYKGLALISMHKFEESIECFDNTLDIDPEYALAWYNKGLALRILKIFEEAIKCYDNALKIDPEDKELWRSKGYTLYQTKSYKEAIECYNEALRIDTEFKEAWNGKGIALFGLNKIDEAIVCYDNALEIDPKFSLACFNKGNALIKLIQYNEAIEYYNKVLEIDPEFKLALYNKGQALLSLKRIEEAIECYDKVLEIDSEFIDAWNRKGITLLILNRTKDAIQCFNKALEIDPQNKISWINKGRVLFNLSRYGEALECYDKILDIYPEFEEAWQIKGNSLQELKNHKEAIKCFDKLLEINADNLSALEDKAYSLLKLHRYNEADLCLDKVLELDMNHANAWYNKACIQSLMNNKGKSTEKLKKAIELDDHYKDSAKDDEDFKNIRDSKEFKELIGE